MKTNFILKNLALSSFVLIGSSVGAHPTLDPEHIHDRVYSRDREVYGPPAPENFISEVADDWFGRCTSAYNELIEARRRANFHSRAGRLTEASKSIRDAIRRVTEGGDLHVVRSPSPGPHLTMAAKEAREILHVADHAVAGLKPDLQVQIEYLIANQMIGLLINAYEDLDIKYARNIKKHCGDCWFDGLPVEYFDGVKNLAVRFIDLQIKLQKYQASDLVELKIAQATAFAAQNFLEIYTGRRAYCGAYNRLDSLTKDICDYLKRPTFPSYEMIPDVRIRLIGAREALDVSNRDCR
jgi:hypothetical protein